MNIPSCCTDIPLKTKLWWVYLHGKAGWHHVLWPLKLGEVQADPGFQQQRGLAVRPGEGKNKGAETPKSTGIPSKGGYSGMPRGTGAATPTISSFLRTFWAKNYCVLPKSGRISLKMSQKLLQTILKKP